MKKTTIGLFLILAGSAYAQSQVDPQVTSGNIERTREEDVVILNAMLSVQKYFAAQFPHLGDPHNISVTGFLTEQTPPNDEHGKPVWNRLRTEIAFHERRNLVHVDYWFLPDSVADQPMPSRTENDLIRISLTNESSGRSPRLVRGVMYLSRKEVPISEAMSIIPTREPQSVSGGVTVMEWRDVLKSACTFSKSHEGDFVLPNGEVVLMSPNGHLLKKGEKLLTYYWPKTEAGEPAIAVPFRFFRAKDLDTWGVDRRDFITTTLGSCREFLDNYVDLRWESIRYLLTE